MGKDLEYYSKLPYTITVEEADDNGSTYFIARVKELPHCLITGSTVEEARWEIRGVMLDWIQSNLNRGLPIPEPEV